MKRIFILLISSIFFPVLGSTQSLQKPDMPYGLSGICKGQKQVNYTTNKVVGATNFVWSLLPDSAGEIIGNDTSIYINFSDSFAGIARLSVMASNASGSSLPSDTLIIRIYDFPSTPVIPFGDTLACSGGASITLWVPSSDNTDSYNWHLSPNGAGFFIENDTSAVLKIYDNYLGELSVAVSAVNTCGESANSNIKKIKIVEAPLTPSTPIGEKLYCQLDSTILIYTKGSANASFYNWQITPDTVFDIETNDTSVFLHPASSFADSFQVRVMAANMCGSSDFSQPLSSFIKQRPQSPQTIEGDTLICKGTDQTIYYTDTISDADRYNWLFFPASAGYASGTTPKGNIYWNTDFLGNAYLSVFTSNICGNSDTSKQFVLHVMDKPGWAKTPSGVDEICVNAQNLIYETDSVAGADYYNWIISPFNAAEFNSDSTKVSVDWLNSFVGTVYLAVRGVNQCGKGLSSDSLVISIKDDLHASFSYDAEGGRVVFTNESFPDLKLNSFLWDFGDGDRMQSYNAQHTYTQSKEYEVKLIVDNPYCRADTNIQKLKIDLNSQAIKYINKGEISIYPNPAEDFITIRFINQALRNFSEIYITDNKGNILIHKKILSKSDFIINITNLKPGIYIVFLQNLNYLYSTKITKK